MNTIAMQEPVNDNAPDSMITSLDLNGARRHGADLAASLHRLRAVVALINSELKPGPLSEAAHSAVVEIDRMSLSLDSLALDFEGVVLAFGAPVVVGRDDEDE